MENCPNKPVHSNAENCHELRFESVKWKQQKWINTGWGFLTVWQSGTMRWWKVQIRAKGSVKVFFTQTSTQLLRSGSSSHYQETTHITFLTHILNTLYCKGLLPCLRHHYMTVALNQNTWSIPTLFFTVVQQYKMFMSVRYGKLLCGCFQQAFMLGCIRMQNNTKIWYKSCRHINKKRNSLFCIFMTPPFFFFCSSYRITNSNIFAATHSTANITRRLHATTEKRETLQNKLLDS